ncbi:hypothetical protein [Candidatus Odyssella acanthamoebae]|uniref:Uncharacterized protein n=1 Tax=Candidatus Odyssella acanthamoebae TaxID=91604 RepID=A0A077AXV9_9PROT|nr:hypothetical protein [Candidatus Paracaedibacter acanthamoebae]AIK96849.1 hypothetical protein ID47_09055 [Candidatus Paracaedibacter acanthamoebae]
MITTQHTLKASPALTRFDFFNRLKELKDDFHNNILFKAMVNGEFTPAARDKFLFHHQFFSDQFQRLIMLRSAMCTHPQLEDIFYGHLVEELGHHKMLEAERNKISLKKDIIIEALTMWFPYQMFSTSPLEQLVIVNCGVETAALIIYHYAIPALDPEKKSEFFRIHEIHDGYHQTMGHDLLKNLTSQEYERLIAILEDTWAILNTLMARLCTLSLAD